MRDTRCTVRKRSCTSAADRSLKRGTTRRGETKTWPGSSGLRLTMAKDRRVRWKTYMALASAATTAAVARAQRTWLVTTKEPNLTTSLVSGILPVCRLRWRLSVVASTEAPSSLNSAPAGDGARNIPRALPCTMHAIPLHPTTAVAPTLHRNLEARRPEGPVLGPISYRVTC